MYAFVKIYMYLKQGETVSSAFKPSPFPFLPFWRRGAATTIIVDAKAPLETQR
jgi:hypothetical protein